MPTRATILARKRGFTLVELLIVIGIIIILIGILLPVLSSARKAAYATDTTNQIKNIGSAIDRYYTDFSAYPGAFSNADLTSGVSASQTAATGRKVNGLTSNLSATENCVLALCGGLTGSGATITTTGLTYTSTDLGRGTLNFNAVQQKRFASYIEAGPQVLSVPGASLNQIGSFGNSDMNSGVNTGVPEFIDRFPDPLAIIYLRANVGAPGVVGPLTSGVICQYSVTQLVPYLPTLPAAWSFDTTSFASNSTYDPAAYAGSYSYFVNASLGVAKRKDTYMLISAGKDRKYGTADDICNFDLQ